MENIHFRPCPPTAVTGTPVRVVTLLELMNLRGHQKFMVYVGVTSDVVHVQV